LSVYFSTVPKVSIIATQEHTRNFKRNQKELLEAREKLNDYELNNGLWESLKRTQR
jgi:hypothetical protein